METPEQGRNKQAKNKSREGIRTGGDRIEEGVQKYANAVVGETERKAGRSVSYRIFWVFFNTMLHIRKTPASAKQME